MTIWYTSDQHFGHKKIIEYCNRPFKSVDEMNEQLVERFNAKVLKLDHTIHLGDFSMHPRELKWLAKLNGSHELCMGNHDACHPCHGKSAHKKVQLYLDAGFSWVYQEGYSGSPPYHRCHFPYTGDHHETEERYKEYRPKDFANRLLHGHVHSTWKRNGRMLNVGVDVWDYAPICMTDIETEFAK